MGLDRLPRGVQEASDEVSQAVSPALGGADGLFGPLRKLVLDAVSSPLVRVLYAGRWTIFSAGGRDKVGCPFSRVTARSTRDLLNCHHLSVGRRIVNESAKPALP